MLGLGAQDSKLKRRKCFMFDGHCPDKLKSKSTESIEVRVKCTLIYALCFMFNLNIDFQDLKVLKKLLGILLDLFLHFF